MTMRLISSCAGLTRASSKKEVLRRGWIARGSPATTLALLIFTASPARAQSNSAAADAAVKAGFPTAPADWASRLTADATMGQCSGSHKNPANAVDGALA